jgi:transcription elongation GreA/GreB family factor
MATTTTPTPTGAVVITREGRERLTQRLHDLDATVLPQLREQLWTKDRDWNDDAALAAALAEHRSIASALAVSVDAESIGDDPDVVEVGDWVTVRDEDGWEETYRIVDPVEAPLDNVRVASTSPFAVAALGHGIGDEIVIQPRVGEPFRYTILSAWRDEPPTGAA